MARRQLSVGRPELSLRQSPAEAAVEIIARETDAARALGHDAWAELFDEHGRLMPELAELAPKGDRRMGANPHANGGLLLRDLLMPDFRDYAVTVPSPGPVQAADTHVLGEFLRDVATLNREQRNLRFFGPDETLSNCQVGDSRDRGGLARRGEYGAAMDRKPPSQTT